MSDAPQIICAASSQMQWLPQLIGAGLAALGGFVAVVYRLRLEKGQEINYIKISLTDELHDIGLIIDKMSETHSAAKIIPPGYFSDLSENSQAFERNRSKLFLIGDSDVRKAICEFYKKLSTEIKKAKDTVGTLKDGDAQPSVTSPVAAIFTSIKTDSQTLTTQINNYKFKPFHIF